MSGILVGKNFKDFFFYKSFSFSEHLKIKLSTAISSTQWPGIKETQKFYSVEKENIFLLLKD